MGGLGAIRVVSKRGGECVPAQIKENQLAATIGTTVLITMPSLWVKILSSKGAAMAEATMPDRSKKAPISPAVVSE